MSDSLFYIHLSSFFLIVTILSVFFFIRRFISYPSLPRAAFFWFIHFPFIFNLFFSFLSMTQPVFPILCAFIVFVAIFHLFSINYWNFQRARIQRDSFCAEWDDVSNAASESTFYSTDLLTIRNHKTNRSVLSVRYSSWICLLQFVSTLFHLDLAIVWQMGVAVQNKHIAWSCKKQFNSRQRSWNHHFKLIRKSASLKFANQSFLLSVLEISFILAAVQVNLKVSCQHCKSNYCVNLM